MGVPLAKEAAAGPERPRPLSPVLAPSTEQRRAGASQPQNHFTFLLTQPPLPWVPPPAASLFPGNPPCPGLAGCGAVLLCRAVVSVLQLCLCPPGRGSPLVVELRSLCVATFRVLQLCGEGAAVRPLLLVLALEEPGLLVFRGDRGNGCQQDAEVLPLGWWGDGPVPPSVVRPAWCPLRCHCSCPCASFLGLGAAFWARGCRTSTARSQIPSPACFKDGLRVHSIPAPWRDLLPRAPRPSLAHRALRCAAGSGARGLPRLSQKTWSPPGHRQAPDSGSRGRRFCNSVIWAERSRPFPWRVAPLSQAGWEHSGAGAGWFGGSEGMLGAWRLPSPWESRRGRVTGHPDIRSLPTDASGTRAAGPSPGM